jgi:hypothetical protein
MKIKRWWEKTELIAMIPTFEEYAEKYLASLPPKPKPVSQVAALQAKVASLQLQLETKQPVPPVEKARDRKA